MSSSRWKGSKRLERFVRASRIVTPSGEIAGAIRIVDGKIAELIDAAHVHAGAEGIDAGSAVVMPGIVDTHAHLNQPGRTEWEGFVTATRAAAAGGITTIVDMPLNSIPVTTSLDSLKKKRDDVLGTSRIDYGFWGGVVPGNSDQLAPLMDAGVMGFKCFLTHSGIDDFPESGQSDLVRAMPMLAERGVPLLVHAELESPVAPSLGDPRAYSTYLASRPARWEVDAIEAMRLLCERFRGPVHIVHLSAADGLEVARRARAEGLPFSVETCPHYLTFTAEEIPDGRTEYKCAPPIRELNNRERLWLALARGEIDLVVSDHSPCTPALKLREQGDFIGAWGGIASLQLGLSTIWTAASARGHVLGDLARWMSASPARLAGLDTRKGSIEVGKDADLTFFDPDASWVIEPSMIRHRHALTPYLGQRVRGRVERTMLRGEIIFEAGEDVGAARGEPLFPAGHRLLYTKGT